MIPLYKNILTILTKLSNLENKKYWTEKIYFSTSNFYIEPENGGYLYLVWISSSGGGNTPSLILIANNSNTSNIFVTNLGGTMFKTAELEESKIKITVNNPYGNYGYIKLM